jgi:hypothetical protein
MNLKDINGQMKNQTKEAVAPFFICTFKIFFGNLPHLYFLLFEAFTRTEFYNEVKKENYQWHIKMF